MKGESKVLLVGDWPPPLGGIAVHLQQLYRHLKDSGVTVAVLDVGKGGHSCADVTPARTPAALARAVRAYAKEGYTIHLHTSGNNRKSWLLALAVAQLAGSAPRVLTVHSGLAASFLARSLLHRGLSFATCASYDRVVAVSEAVADALRQASVPRDLVLVQAAFLPGAVQVGQPPEGFAAARSRRAPLLSYAHHPSKVYGREVMFRALKMFSARYPDVGLAVFGPGAGAEDFWAEARLAKAEGLLEVYGELPHDQALAIVAASDAFVRPTTADGDAVSVREALSLGTRCVASDAAARPDGVATFRTGDAADLCEQLFAALSKAPVQRAQPDAGAALLALYREVSAPRPRFGLLPVPSNA